MIITTPGMGKSWFYKRYQEYMQSIGRCKRPDNEVKVVFDEFSNPHLDEEIIKKLREKCKPKHGVYVFTEQKERKMSREFDESLGYNEIVRREK